MPQAKAATAVEPEPTVQARVICREGIGWSLYEITLPKSFLQEGVRLRQDDDFASVLGFQHHYAVKEHGL